MVSEIAVGLFCVLCSICYIFTTYKITFTITAKESIKRKDMQPTCDVKAAGSSGSVSKKSKSEMKVSSQNERLNGTEGDTSLTEGDNSCAERLHSTAGSIGNFVESSCSTESNIAFNKSIGSQKNSHLMNSKSNGVGILAMEIYVPKVYVAQCDLEKFDGVSNGKYTIGLGQEKMGFVHDNEDINSILLTVVKSLLSKYKISVMDVGRIEIGTESLVDKSKSSKTLLMDLFGDNVNVEGVTNVNACYGGTAALFNCVDWMEGSNWNGKYAICVAGDIACYEKGNARPTGGCGAVACLVGRDAPIVITSGVRTTHASNVWDFYKPNPYSEYPTVNGVHSQECYLRALDSCYKRFGDKMESSVFQGVDAKRYDIHQVDYAVFHSPYHKLVQKSFARMVYNDFLKDKENEKFEMLKDWKNTAPKDTYNSRELDLVLRKMAKGLFEEKVIPTCTVSQKVGNCYTASVFMNIANTIDTIAKENVNGKKKAIVFSYGSGSMASMYHMEFFSNNTDENSPFTIAKMAKCMNIEERLNARIKCTPQEFNDVMDIRQQRHGQKSYIPISSMNNLFDGTFYLEEINDMYERKYRQYNAAKSSNMGNVVKMINTNMDVRRKNNTITPKIGIVGVSAGLPSIEHDQYVCFDQTSIQTILAGKNCISKLSNDKINTLLDKRIVQVVKNKDKTTTRHPVLQAKDSVKLAAVTGNVPLTENYGLSPAIVACMDKSSRLAVAAGLEAMIQAKLISREKLTLHEKHQASTGIIFATSFPALDAAVAELSRFFNMAQPKDRLIVYYSLKERVSSGEIQFSTLEEKNAWFSFANHMETCTDTKSVYEFNRKFLFRVLVLANAQLAQIAKARGPNMQINGACAGTSMAIGLAQDWIRLGKCERVVVVAGDSASEDNLFDWIGSGFRALGAISLASEVDKAALPFDAARNGIVLGSGGVGFVVEATKAVVCRGNLSLIRSYLVASQYSNSAFHGAALDAKHIASELNRFLTTVEAEHDLTRDHIAKHCVYYSHETFTHASPTSSCAYSEITALRSVFGLSFDQILIANTKGFTGHPMGVSFEDVAAIEGLHAQTVPPVVNYSTHDERLGIVPLNLSKGGSYASRYALRFAAGFGSQLAFTLYQVCE